VLVVPDVNVVAVKETAFELAVNEETMTEPVWAEQESSLSSIKSSSLMLFSLGGIAADAPDANAEAEDEETADGEVDLTIAVLLLLISWEADADDAENDDDEEEEAFVVVWREDSEDDWSTET